MATASATLPLVGGLVVSGACSPASSQTRARVAARARSIPASVAGPSAARVSSSRLTVGPEATWPNTPGSARSQIGQAGAADRERDRETSLRHLPLTGRVRMNLQVETGKLLDL